MRTLHLVMHVTVWGFASVGTVGCYASACEQAFPGEACPQSGLGGAAGTTTSGLTSATMQSASSTGVDPTCVPSEPTWTPSAACGVFVRQGGAGNGTPDAPFGGLVEALAAQRPIYIAEGEYLGAVTLPSGTVVFGGLRADWTFDATVRPVITAAPDEIPVTLDAGASTTELHHLTIEAKSAELPGGSSVAMVIAETPSVLDNVDLVAGDGMAGASSTTPTDDIGPTDPNNPDIKGNAGAAASVTDPDEETPGAPIKQNPRCGVSVGGKGGDGGSVVIGSPSTPQDASPGGTGSVADGACVGSFCGAGGSGQRQVGQPQCEAGDGGKNGANGENGFTVTSLGILSVDGFAPASPGNGLDGSPGQGGGGGGGAMGKIATDTRGASGGSGGAGGCGGKGAPGGGGGGSSIALIVLGTSPTFSAVTLTIGDAGDGGGAADGQLGVVGGNGGDGGLGVGTLVGCNGGRGGQGGNGGHGAGGRGGHAIGIAYNGTAPTGGFTLIASGLEGAGGMSSGSIGISGESAETLDFIP